MDDERFMRRAFDVARHAAENGNPPFGAILVDTDGKIVFEAENDAAVAGDGTGHAELNLVRVASRELGPETVAGLTIYTSCEPCCMCTGALVWCGLERLVFGLSATRLHAVRGSDTPPVLDLASREVVARSSRAIEVTGPFLEDEAAALFAT